MSTDNKKHYLYVNGQKVPVSEQVYRAYWQYTEKERYFMNKMKQEKFICDQEQQVAVFLPSREDSYERLLESDQQFAANQIPVDVLATSSVWIQELMACLSEEERAIIYQLYYLDKSEREACSALHIARTTFQRRKKKLLERLRTLLENNF